MAGYTRITKAQFYANGGFANPRCVRISRGGSYAHYYYNHL